MSSDPRLATSEPIDVLALVASAGGHAAVITVLKSLPADFWVPIVVMQHLPPEANQTVEMYARFLPFTVEEVRTGSVIAPGTVLVCPLRSFVELLPDGTCIVTPCERGAVDKPIDRFLESVASSFAYHAIGVVLTGMGADGALGARQLHRAGGRVLVQSESTADFPDMPRAAIKAGAADLVAPLQDIGQVINEIVAGASQPQPRSELEAIRSTFGDKGEVAALAREIDWAQHPLGFVYGWPTQLRELVRLVVEYPGAAQLLWSEQRFTFFNDASLLILGAQWKSVFGSPYDATFPNLPDATELQRRVLRGERIWLEEVLFAYERDGRLQDSWFDVAYTPVCGVDGAVLGIYSTWFERTREVLAARRLETLNRLAAAPVALNRRAALAETLAMLQASADISFAAAYLLDGTQTQALLAGAFGADAGSALAPHQLFTASATDVWPLKQVLDANKPVVVADLAERLRRQRNRQDQAMPEAALVYPLLDQVEGQAAGVLVLGTSPRLALDELYQGFLTLAGETIAAKVAESHARQREHERLERLAELDRTKTEFFANISHEFRTPLTLLLGPLEELLRQREQLPAPLGGELEVAASNARRLMRLVNSLLDFSEIESRRQQAKFEPVDLGALTTDIASPFRSAIEAAGLSFRITCDPNLQPVWIDREMWEKIVSNLLSNAFKFTFAGEITLELRALSLHAELTVRDTGVGIPADEVPNLFKRFHRVRGARARTVEGSGIGLAIVDDLVKRLGGQLTVRSRENWGSAFTVWVPYQSSRVQGERAVPGISPITATEDHVFAGELAREAAQWLLDSNAMPSAVIDDLLGPLAPNGEARRGKILVADDNGDLRSYLERLLSPRWEVELAVDGEAALAAAGRVHPDVILADVMMPGMDGFELIQRVRANDQLQHTPVILLTARAGEEAAIQGLLAGADDYIAKPFSPRELVARIQAAAERARAERALRESEAKFRTVFESIDEGFLIHEIIWDESGRAIDYRLLEINPAYTRMTGLPRDTVGKLGSEFMPDVEGYWLDIFGRVARTGLPERAEMYNQPTGRWYNVQVSRVAGHDSRIAIVFDDVTARKEAELTLQASAERQAFLLKLSDALRAEASPDAVAKRAIRMLAEQMQLDRCWLSEVFGQQGISTVGPEHRRPALAPMAGVFQLADYPATMLQLATQPLVISDTSNDPDFADAEKALLAQLNLRALLVAPLRKGPQDVVWALAAAMATPRNWTDAERVLLEDVAERTWAAIERCRAEAALRKSEE